MADFERPPSHPDEPDRHEVPAQGDRSFPVSAPPPTPLASTTANPIPQQPATTYVPVGPQSSQRGFHGVLAALVGVIALVFGLVAQSNLFDLFLQGKLRINGINR